MVTLTVTHSKVSSGTVNADVEVDLADWNATHVVTGAENVDNTSDANKPISTATQTALDAKISSSLLTTRGDIIYRDASAPARLAKGAQNTILTMGANDPAWATASAWLDATIGSTRGMMLLRGSASWGALAVGASTYVLTSNGTDPAWAAPTGGRELLVAARTYYVRTDGSDSNNGLANTSGGAFLTIGKALTTASSIDTGAYQLTISVQAGTFTANLSLPKMVGSLPPILTGVGATTIITGASSHVISNDGGGAWIVQSVKLTGSSSLSLMYAVNGGVTKFSGVEFSTGSFYHTWASPGGTIAAVGNYTVSGGASSHLLADGGYINIRGTSAITCTITGTPAFSEGFANSVTAGLVDAYTAIFSGAATGPRYTATTNGVIFTGGGGASFFPGNSAGSTATGGQYA